MSRNTTANTQNGVLNWKLKELMCREWPASCQPRYSGYAQENIKMTVFLFQPGGAAVLQSRKRKMSHDRPQAFEMNTAWRRLLVAKISQFLKWESLKFFKFKSLKQKLTWRGDSHTGLEGLTPVMRLTISPTSRRVRTSVPDGPELIVQEQGGSLSGPSMAPPG